MNKTETLMVALLFCCLLGWMALIAPKQAAARRAAEEAAAAAAATNQSATATNSFATGSDVTASNAVAPSLGVPSAPASVATPNQPTAVPAPGPVAPPRERAPEQRATMTNEHVVVTLTSWGGGVASVELLDQARSVTNRDEHVILDFSQQAALEMDGIPGLPDGGDFKLAEQSARKVVFTAEAGDLTLTRVFELGDTYETKVTDSFANTSDGVAVVPAHTLTTGPMRMHSLDPMSTRYGYLGAETMGAKKGSRPIMTWGKKLLSAFGGGGGCRRGPPAETLPPLKSLIASDQQAWVAVKSKHFIQIVTPEGGCGDTTITAYRDMESKQVFVLDHVDAKLSMAQATLEPGQTHVVNTSYYAGPTKYAELKKLGGTQNLAMFRSFRGWGWWRAACIGLLYLLNGIHAVVRNYGVAIIVLTVIVRGALLPLTHKSTESMRKMQKLAPEIEKIKKRYKDPQKVQQKTMELYRAHGTNPLMGCLPMFLQMPVFIALYTVLRGAVELRLAPFIPPWIQDLSASEGLFKSAMAGFPLVQELNILPLIMTATTLLQQKLQPTNADPQQKQMMYMMPVMFLFFFYKMPSGLVLYWTVSQALSIAQIYWKNKREDRKEAEAAAIATPA